jgi:cell wall-associated NlpC family hydrolase
LEPKLLSASRPVVALYREPREARLDCDRVDLQESQLLNNELFQALAEERDWYYGEAIEQPYSTEKGWRGYPGWVKKSDMAPVAVMIRPNAVITAREAAVFPERECAVDRIENLPLASRLAAEPEYGNEKRSCKVHLYSGRVGWVRRDALRLLECNRRISTQSLIREVVGNAFLFLGVPYVWGGRSIPLPYGPSRVVSGVDCSALVCLSYRLSGIDIPRNARDQSIFAESVPGDEMQTGDLLFIGTKDLPNSIGHVMISIGHESMIEASETGRTVAETSFVEKFGVSYSQLGQAGFVVEGRRIHFGRITQGLDIFEALNQFTPAKTNQSH